MIAASVAIAIDRRSQLVARAVTLLLVTLLAALALLPSRALGAFALGLQDPGLDNPAAGPEAQFANNAMRTVHGSTVRITVGWGSVAPSGSERPVGFDPSNPDDPAYRWSATDAAVRAASQHHERILMTLTGAPQWAQAAGQPDSLKQYGGAWNPSAAQFGLFAQAAATRYSGHFADPLTPGRTLPRVKLWEIWNEENLPEDLTSSNPVDEYRSLLNAAYGAIKSIHADNTIAIGGLAPVSFLPNVSVSPLRFAAQLLCLRRVGVGFVRAARCPTRARFDVLAMHPYSLDATPTLHAANYDDVLVADMGKLTALLRAVNKLHTAASGGHHGLWVTEWSWFTNPPDAAVGDSGPRAARYTAYSMYQFWRTGVSLVVWFLAKDVPVSLNSPDLVGGGALYTSSGRPKPMLRAFDFPVVAGVGGGGHGFVWGRAPVSKRTEVFVQRRDGRRWIQIANVRTSADGVFQVRFRARGNASYRARVAHGPVSLGYYSSPIPARQTHRG